MTDRQVAPATCLGCGCLCDDIVVTAVEGRIIEARNGCELGQVWFRATRPGTGQPSTTIEGRMSSHAEAIDRAAAILATAKAPMVWGLTGSTVEGVASALAIADGIGAAVEIAGTDGRDAILRAFERVGQISATLGEVKDRADVVVFWGVDPVTTHPRHWSRYSVAPRGRLIPGGRPDRFVIAVGPSPTATSKLADLFVPIEADRQAEILDVLRAIVQGLPLDLDRIARSSGVDAHTLIDFGDRLKSARYGAFFFDSALGQGSGGSRAAEAAFRLIRDLNRQRRFVATELGEPGNSTGSRSVLTWQTGAPSATDFGRGFPRFLPDDAALAHRLARGEVDAVLIVADGPTTRLNPTTLDLLAQVPTIAVAPGSTSLGWLATVAFDVARPGIESGGTVERVDGVMLPASTGPGTSLPTERAILDALRLRLVQGGWRPRTSQRRIRCGPSFPP